MSIRAIPFVLAFLVASAGSAQTPARSADGAPPTPAPAEVKESRAGAIVNVEFKGGTVGEYIDALKASNKGVPINLVANDRTRKTLLGPISLTCVSASAAAEAIPGASAIPHRGNWDIVFHSDRFAGTTGVPSFSVNIKNDLNESPEATQSVFSLASYLIAPGEGQPGMDAKTVLAAIEQALELASREKKGGEPTVRYHQESQLLMIRGTPAHLETIAHLLRALKDGQAAVGVTTWELVDKKVKSETGAQSLAAFLHLATGDRGALDELKVRTMRLEADLAGERARSHVFEKERDMLMKRIGDMTIAADKARLDAQSHRLGLEAELSTLRALAAEHNKQPK